MSTFQVGEWHFINGPLALQFTWTECTISHKNTITSSTLRSHALKCWDGDPVGIACAANLQNASKLSFQIFDQHLQPLVAKVFLQASIPIPLFTLSSNNQIYAEWLNWEASSKCKVANDKSGSIKSLRHVSMMSNREHFQNYYLNFALFVRAHTFTQDKLNFKVATSSMIN